MARALLFVAVLLCCVLLLESLVSIAFAQSDLGRRSMVWMCLERCEDTRADILNQLSVIKQNARSLTSVSFELYNIGPKSSLVRNTDLSQDIHKAVKSIRGFGDKPLQSLPMISSYPYPPDLINWMRDLWSNPKPFVDTCIQEGLKYGYDGYNLDLEPTTGISVEDAQKYASFIHVFANALHDNGMYLTVDTAAWSSLWNYTLISQALSPKFGDRMITMGTYTSAVESWTQQFQKVMNQSVPTEAVGIGLMPVGYKPERPLTKEEVQFRFDSIRKNGKVREVDVWRIMNKEMAADSFWWEYLANFLLGQ